MVALMPVAGAYTSTQLPKFDRSELIWEWIPANPNLARRVVCMALLVCHQAISHLDLPPE
jgi:hypothetical protein